jgi:hypothetical protein
LPAAISEEDRSTGQARFHRTVFLQNEHEGGGVQNAVVTSSAMAPLPPARSAATHCRRILDPDQSLNMATSI